MGQGNSSDNATGSQQLDQILIHTEPVLPKPHVPPHQSILNLGHSAIHYVENVDDGGKKKKKKKKKNVPTEGVLLTRHINRIQHDHYYFAPRMQYFVNLDAAAKTRKLGEDMKIASDKSKALLYVKPGSMLKKAGKGKRLYFVAQGARLKNTKTKAEEESNLELIDEIHSSVVGTQIDEKVAEILPESTTENPEEEKEIDFFNQSRLDALQTSILTERKQVEEAFTTTTEILENANIQKNLECLLCATDAMVDPLIAECKHICCNECWMTWLDETKDTGGVCPECEEPVDEEHLYPVSMCSMCQLPPTDPWKAPCGHEGCKSCWVNWIKEQDKPNCPSCSIGFEASLLPFAIEK